MSGEFRSSKVLGVPSEARAQSGQSLVEVALLLPLLLLLVLGTIEMGRYAYFAILVGNAAHAGAAYGAQSVADASNPACSSCSSGYASVNPGIQLAADNDFQNNGQSLSNLTVNSSTSCACDSSGVVSLQTTLCSTALNPGITTTIATCQSSSGHWIVMVSVDATGNYSPLFNYPGIPTGIAVTRTATMRVSN